MKEKMDFEKENKKLQFGKHQIKITTYYLWHNKAGLRIEVKKFTYTQTVEIKLLVGDDILVLKKVYEYVALKQPTKKEIDAVIEKFIQRAKDLKLIH
jgi:hypothetical protein